MTLTEVSQIRLQNQQISAQKFSAAKEILNWMGAMQAQDYAMAKWAVGLRLPNTSSEMIQASIDSGEILRTHVLRPTWHFVSSENIRWMQELTAPRILKSMKSGLVRLQLPPTALAKSLDVIEKALSKEKHLPREELVLVLGKNGIKNEDNRISHVLIYAELQGLICSGKDEGKKHTYALLDDRVPKIQPFHKEEALAKLAHLYFSSHGPATIADFSWWSGLSLTEARQGLEVVKQALVSEKIGEHMYWFDPSFSLPKQYKDSLYLLPAFDEFLISYKDRSAIITFEDHKKTVSNNGMFRPIIVINGEIVGVWKRIFKKDRIVIEINSFRDFSSAIKKQVEAQALVFGEFMGERIEIMSC